MLKIKKDHAPKFIGNGIFEDLSQGYLDPSEYLEAESADEVINAMVIIEELEVILIRAGLLEYI